LMSIVVLQSFRGARSLVNSEQNSSVTGLPPGELQASG